MKTRFELDPAATFHARDDGTFYLESGDDYYDVTFSREAAEALCDWLIEVLAREPRT